MNASLTTNGRIVIEIKEKGEAKLKTIFAVDKPDDCKIKNVYDVIGHLKDLTEGKNILKNPDHRICIVKGQALLVQKRLI